MRGLVKFAVLILLGSMLGAAAAWAGIAQYRMTPRPYLSLLSPDGQFRVTLFRRQKERWSAGVELTATAQCGGKEVSDTVDELEAWDDVEADYPAAEIDDKAFTTNRLSEDKLFIMFRPYDCAMASP